MELPPQELWVVVTTDTRIWNDKARKTPFYAICTTRNDAELIAASLPQAKNAVVEPFTGAMAFVPNAEGGYELKGSMRRAGTLF